MLMVMSWVKSKAYRVYTLYMSLSAIMKKTAILKLKHLNDLYADMYILIAAVCSIMDRDMHINKLWKGTSENVFL